MIVLKFQSVVWDFWEESMIWKKKTNPRCLEITDMGLKSLSCFLSSNTLHPETHFGSLHCLFKALHWHEIIFLLCIYCLGKKPSCVLPSFPGCLICNKFWATLTRGFFRGEGESKLRFPFSYLQSICYLGRKTIVLTAGIKCVFLFAVEMNFGGLLFFFSFSNRYAVFSHNVVAL